LKSREALFSSLSFWLKRFARCRHEDTDEKAAPTCHAERSEASTHAIPGHWSPRMLRCAPHDMSALTQNDDIGQAITQALGYLAVEPLIRGKIVAVIPRWWVAAPLAAILSRRAWWWPARINWRRMSSQQSCSASIWTR